MPILMLNGWLLEKGGGRSHAALKDEDAEHFFLNSAHLVSAHEATRGDKSGYLLRDTQGELYFLCVSQAELSQMVRMAVNEAQMGT